MSESQAPDFYAVIPAGGSGSRLWPLSRADAPKFLHDLSGNGKSLLKNTVDRVLQLAGIDGIFVVTGAAHYEAVQHDLPELPASRILVEPTGKDSAAAIALAALFIHRENPDAVIGSFAADHVISDSTLFSRAVEQAIGVAREGQVVTIGVRPTEPSSAFGYIETAGDAGSLEVLAVERFVEKPSYDEALSYLRAGNFFWNAGMFIARVSVVVEVLRRNAPQLVKNLEDYVDALSEGDSDRANHAWSELPQVAIDYVLAEPVATAGGMSMVVAEFGWDDVGDFAALAKVRQSESQEDITVLGSNDKVVAVDASGVVVSNSRRVVSLVGVTDIVVVDTPDALLVTTKGHAQDVKKMVEHMKLEGLDTVL